VRDRLVWGFEMTGELPSRHLEELQITGCTRLKAHALAYLAPLAPRLLSLSLRGCTSLGQRAAEHLAPLTSLTSCA
jgi:hypothetical protein